MVRTPFFPKEVFDRIAISLDLRKDLLDLYKQSIDLREAIAIASPELYKALQSIDPADNQAIFSLFKYVTRMATRATPFGLFSSVSIGHISSKTTGNVDMSYIQRVARPDMEWLMTVLDSSNANESLAIYSKVKKNPLLVKSMGRILLPYMRLKTEKEKKEISIQATPLIFMILEKTADFISIQELLDSLKKTAPHLEEDKLLHVLKTLLKEEILISSTFPSLLTMSPLKNLINNLQTTNPKVPLLEYLESISSFIENYNQKGGDVLFQEIDTKMRSVASPSTVLQVDTTLHNEIKLPSAVITEISQAAEALWRLSFAPLGIPHLRKYHNKFLEKWGMFRIIPLLDLIDEHAGLGFPESYESKEIEQDKQYISEEWQQFLAWKWMLSVQGHENEIVITDNDIEKFGITVTKEKAPSSLDVYCEVIASSPQDIDQGNYLVVLQPTVAGGDGMATFGRFLHLFNENDLQAIQDILHTEEAHEQDQIFVEGSYFPSNARSANVAIHPNLRKLNINLGYGNTPQTISLEDIYVGATDQHLFLTLKNGQRLNVVSMNVLNPQLGPKLIRFLREISKDQYHLLHPFPWGNLQNMAYLPRVRYQKTVLLPAKWHLTLSLLEATEKDSIQTLCKKIDHWADKQKVPVTLFLMFADHRILLNRKHDFHLQEVARHLKTRKEIILMENVGEVGWISSTLGTYRSELVIPILKNAKYCSSKPYNIPFQTISHSERWKAPGSEWTYTKLYLKESGKDALLKKHFPPLIQELMPYLHCWFFVQYNDKEGPHLRLRLRYKENNHSTFTLSSWAEKLMESGAIKEYSFHPYEREIERYGGVSAINAAEELFHADSEVALYMLHHKTTLPNYVIASLSLLDLLQNFKISISEQIQLFESMQLNKKELEGFRSWKSTLLSYAKQILEKKPEVEEVNLLMHIFARRHAAQKKYLSCLKEIPSLNAAIISILHMHCNRFLGINNKLEQKSYLFASHVLQILHNSCSAKTSK